jgi:glutathione S-transferase
MPGAFCLGGLMPSSIASPRAAMFNAPFRPALYCLPVENVASCAFSPGSYAARPAVVGGCAAHLLKGPLAFGAKVTVANVYLVPQIESARRFKVDLVPQIESARRFKVDLGRWPRLQEIDEVCGRPDAFRRAAPAAQPDAG